MKTYQHTQPATIILLIVPAIALVQLVIGVTVNPKCLVAAAVLMAAAWLFRSLTVEITDEELHWRFGARWLGKRFRLSDIVSAEVVRTSVMNGWGIHHSRFGWLYNVSGFDAVAITLRNGKRFCLGTDEPQVLAARLNERR
jgi:hypothetical protein